MMQQHDDMIHGSGYDLSSGHNQFMDRASVLSRPAGALPPASHDTYGTHYHTHDLHLHEAHYDWDHHASHQLHEPQAPNLSQASPPTLSVRANSSTSQRGAWNAADADPVPVLNAARSQAPVGRLRKRAKTDAALIDKPTITPKNHGCTIPGCNKFFTSSGHLARHIRTHAGKQPCFNCPFDGCSSAFGNQPDMLEHYATHDEVSSDHSMHSHGLYPPPHNLSMSDSGTFMHPHQGLPYVSTAPSVYSPYHPDPGEHYFPQYTGSAPYPPMPLPNSAPEPYPPMQANHWQPYSSVPYSPIYDFTPSVDMLHSSSSSSSSAISYSPMTPLEGQPIPYARAPMDRVPRHYASTKGKLDEIASALSKKKRKSADSRTDGSDDELPVVAPRSRANSTKSATPATKRSTLLSRTQSYAGSPYTIGGEGMQRSKSLVDLLTDARREGTLAL